MDKLPINFEKNGETCRSPFMVLKHREAHCMEGAMLAAAALWYNGESPLLLDLKTNGYDSDHVVTLFRQGRYWGALSKTNHAVLRYRDPVFSTIRELALSYFNEYFLDNGVKIMRSYSAPYSLLKHGDKWLASEKDLLYVADALDRSKHFDIVNKKTTFLLRKADPIERKAGKITEWKRR